VLPLHNKFQSWLETCRPEVSFSFAAAGHAAFRTGYVLLLPTRARGDVRSIPLWQCSICNRVLECCVAPLPLLRERFHSFKHSLRGRSKRECHGSRDYT
jgi:hypothetical protein